MGSERVGGIDCPQDKPALEGVSSSFDRGLLTAESE